MKCTIGFLSSLGVMAGAPTKIKNLVEYVYYRLVNTVNLDNNAYVYFVCIGVWDYYNFTSMGGAPTKIKKS